MLRCLSYLMTQVLLGRNQDTRDSRLPALPSGDRHRWPERRAHAQDGQARLRKVRERNGRILYFSLVYLGSIKFGKISTLKGVHFVSYPIKQIYGCVELRGTPQANEHAQSSSSNIKSPTNCSQTLEKYSCARHAILCKVSGWPTDNGGRLRPRFPRRGVGGEGPEDLSGDGDRGAVRWQIFLSRRQGNPGTYIQHWWVFFAFLSRFLKVAF